MSNKEDNNDQFIDLFSDEFIQPDESKTEDIDLFSDDFIQPEEEPVKKKDFTELPDSSEISQETAPEFTANIVEGTQDGSYKYEWEPTKQVELDSEIPKTLEEKVKDSKKDLQTTDEIKAQLLQDQNQKRFNDALFEVSSKVPEEVGSGIGTEIMNDYLNAAQLTYPEKYKNISTMAEYYQDDNIPQSELFRIYNEAIVHKYSELINDIKILDDRFAYDNDKRAGELADQKREQIEQLKNYSHNLIKSFPELVKKEKERIKENDWYDKNKVTGAALESAERIWNIVPEYAKGLAIFSKGLYDKGLDVVGADSEVYSGSDAMLNSMMNVAEAFSADVPDTGIYNEEGDIKAERAIPQLVGVVGNMAALIYGGRGFTKALTIAASKGGKVTLTANQLRALQATGTAMMATSMNVAEGYEEAKRNGLSDSDAMDYANRSASINGLMEATFAEIPLTKLGFNKMNSVINKIKSGKKISYKDFGIDVLKDLPKETLEELGVAVGDKVFNAYYNNKLEGYTGVTPMETQFRDNEIKEMAGFTMAATLILRGSTLKGLGKTKYNESLIHALDNKDEFDDTIKAYRNSGVLSEQDYDRINNEVDRLYESNKKVPETLDIEPERKLKVLDAIATQNDLENEKTSLHESFHPEIDKRIEASKSAVNNLIKGEDVDDKVLDAIRNNGDEKLYNNLIQEDAKEIRTEATETGKQDGIKRGEEEGVRVRDDKEAWLESEEVDNDIISEVQNGDYDIIEDQVNEKTSQLNLNQEEITSGVAYIKEGKIDSDPAQKLIQSIRDSYTFEELDTKNIFSEEQIDKAIKERQDELSKMGTKSYKEQVIHDNLGRIRASDYKTITGLSDKDISRGMYPRYFNKNSKPIDIIAQELSSPEFEITEQDIIDYIQDKEFNPGKYKNTKVKELNEAANIPKELEDAFPTDFDLETTETIQKEIDALERARGIFNDEDIDADIEFLKQKLNEKTNIEATKDISKVETDKTRKIESREEKQEEDIKDQVPAIENQAKQLMDEDLKEDENNGLTDKEIEAEREAIREGLKQREKEIIDDVFPSKQTKKEVKKNADQVAMSTVAPIRTLYKAARTAQRVFSDIEAKIFEKRARRLEDFIANKAKEGITSSNKATQKVNKFFTLFANGLPRTQEDTFRKGRFIGEINFSSITFKETINDLHNMINKDPESLQKVHMVMDPSIYDKERLTYNDLNDIEKRFYDKVRSINDYIHDWNYAMGFINKKTYEKFKGNYLARAYEPLETPADVEQMINDGSFVTSGDIGKKLNLNIFKARKELNEKMKQEKVTDVAYLTAKRLSQTQRNAAILEYANYVKNDPKLTSDTPKKGFSELEGRAYGSLGSTKNKPIYVADHIVEDFKGFYFNSKWLNTAYDAMKLYDKNALRQFFKKYHTVYSPVVQLGNMSANIVFAFNNGISPTSFVINSAKAYKEVKNKGEIYKKLIKYGILQEEILTKDLRPATSRAKEISREMKELNEGWAKRTGRKFLQKYKQFDDKATELYGMSDDIAKMSAFMSHKEAGLTDKEAVQRVYEGFQNYSTVGKIWDVASKTPVFGNPYVKFTADLMRIIKNSVTRRPLTTITYLAALKATAYLASNFSDEDELEKEIREERAFTPKILLPELVGGDIPLIFKIGDSEVNLARFIAPFYRYDLGELEHPMESVSDYLPFSINMYDAREAGTNEVMLKTPDVLIGPWIQAFLLDRDFRAKRISDPEATMYKESGIGTGNKLLNQFTYVMRSQVPGFQFGHDVALSYIYGSDYYDRKRDVTKTIMSKFLKVQDYPKGEYQEEINSQLKRIENKITNKIKTQNSIKSASYRRINKAEKEYNEGVINKRQLENIIEREDSIVSKRVQEIQKEIVKYQDQLKNKAMRYKNILNNSVYSKTKKSK